MELNLEDIIQREERELIKFSQSLESSHTISQSMVTIITRLQTNIAEIEREISPLQNNIQQLRELNEKTEGSIRGINQILNIITQIKDVEIRVKQGPRGDFEQYAKYLNELSQTKQFFISQQLSTHFKSSLKILPQLEEMIKYGQSECDKVLCNTIAKASAAVDPSKCYNSESLKQLTSPIPHEKLSEIKSLLTVFQINNNENENWQWKKDYKEQRGKYIVYSLQKLKAVDDSINSSDPHPTTHYLKNSHPLLSYFDLFIVMLTAEKNLSIELFGKRKYKDYFNKISEIALDNMIDVLSRFQKISTYQSGSSIISSAISGQSSSAVSVSSASMSEIRISRQFVMFDIYEHFTRSLPNLSSLFPESEMFDKVKQIIDKCMSECKSSIYEISEDIRKETLKSIRSDGNVDQMTSIILNYLKRLFDYKKVVLIIISDNVQPSQTSKSLKSSRKPSKTNTFHSFLRQLMGELIDYLEKKAKNEKSQMLSAIFLLNNYYHIEKIIKLSDELSSVFGPSFIAEIDKNLDGQFSFYRSLWNPIIELLVVRKKFGKKSFDSSTSQRSRLKSQLIEFNEAIDNLYQEQQQFIIADKDLKERLTTDIKTVIIPLYNSLISSWCEVTADNLRKREKYMKYSAKTLSKMIDHLFEGNSRSLNMQKKRISHYFKNPSISLRNV